MCKCGKINEWANSPYFPIKSNSKLNSYSLFVKENSSILLRHCFECGDLILPISHSSSDVLSNLAKNEIPCNCDLIRKWSEDNESSIDFSEKLKGYVIYTSTTVDNLNFCFSCGGALPQHIITNPFVEIDSSERKQAEEKFQQLRTISEIISELGNPNISNDLTDSNSDTNGQIKRILEYWNVGKTFDLIVQEYADGRNVEIIFMPKIKEPSFSPKEQIVVEKIRNVQTSKDVIELLGQPEKHIKFFYSLHERELLIYKNLKLPSDLFVKISANGKLNYSFS